MNMLRLRTIEGAALVLTSVIALIGCAADGQPVKLKLQSGPDALSNLFAAPSVVPADRAAPARSVALAPARTYPMATNAAPSMPSTAQASYQSAAPAVAKSATVSRPPLVTLAPKADLVEEVVRRSDGVILVDFYADWCGPCKTQGAILHEVAGAAAQVGASIIKVNVDEHEALAAQLQVESLPTIIVIKDGRIVQRKTGLADVREVAAWLGLK